MAMRWSQIIITVESVESVELTRAPSLSTKYNTDRVINYSIWLLTLVSFLIMLFLVMELNDKS